MEIAYSAINDKIIFSVLDGSNSDVATVVKAIDGCQMDPATLPDQADEKAIRAHYGILDERFVGS